MSDAILTEKRLIELLEPRFKAIDARFEAIEARLDAMDARFDAIELRLDKIESQMKEVLLFQRYEAETIEYELEMVLVKYLQKKYELNTISLFALKYIHDPYTYALVTELDVALYISPHKKESKTVITFEDCPYAKNLKFIKKQEQLNNYSSLNNNTRRILQDDDAYLVIAEAKHNLTYNKIASKLRQFDIILNYFKCVNDVKNEKTDGLHRKFIMTVKRNNQLLNIKNIHFYFGAAFWGKGIGPKLQNDIKLWKIHAKKFKNSTKSADKIKAFKDIINIEKKWYTDHDNPSHQTEKLKMTDTQILSLETVDGAMNHLDLIFPSGERYKVDDEKEPEGVLSLITRKTRKLLR